jgi:hypothetical protein
MQKHLWRHSYPNVTEVMNQHNLEDSNSTWWASDSTLDMQWRARQEKTISLHALALLTQFLEIPHLTNRHSPSLVSVS